MDDRQEFLDQFLLYGHVLTAEEIEAAGEEGVPHTPPTLDQYKEQVDTYEKIYVDVNEFEVRMFMCIDVLKLKFNLMVQKIKA